MAQLKRADDRVAARNHRQVAERTGVTSVVVGSYEVGDTIRINVRLQDAKTGRIISSERVEANESTLFTMVDDLSRRIRSQFQTFRAEVGSATALLNKPGTTPDLASTAGWAT
jgi:TolB-like protein